MEAQLKNERKKVIQNVIYRLPHGNFSLFLQEIERLNLRSEINEADVIYLGNFYIWVDDTVQPAYTERFGAAKPIPYIQRNRISEIHLYIYIYIYISIYICIYILQGRASHNKYKQLLSPLRTNQTLSR